MPDVSVSAAMWQTIDLRLFQDYEYEAQNASGYARYNCKMLESGPNRPRLSQFLTTALRRAIAIGFTSLTLLATWTAEAQTAHASSRIHHYEQLNDLLVVQSHQNAQSNKPSAATSPTAISFSAFGSRYDVKLRPNYRLVNSLLASGQILDSAVTVFAGEIENQPGSWARFSLMGERISGIVAIDGELLVIDSAQYLQSLIGNSIESNAPLIFKASDLVLLIDGPVGDTANRREVKASDLIQRLGKTTKSLLPLPTRAISLGLIGDSGFAAGERPMESLLRDANMVDGIFSSQMDMHLHLEQIDLYDGDTDPFTGNDPSDLVAQLAAIKLASPTYSQLGLLHLLARRDFVGNALGSAAFESICGATDGVGVTEALHGVSFITMAHEIAHNFGAPHDGEVGSACAAAGTGFIMAAEYSGTYEFSQCSIQEMNSFLAEAACLSTVGPAELELNPEPYVSQIYSGEPNRVHYRITNMGVDSLFDGQTNVSVDTSLDLLLYFVEAPFRRCPRALPNNTGDISCDLGNIFPGESMLFGIEVLPTSSGTAAVNLSASALNDTTMNNNSAVIQFDVQPATLIAGSVDGQIDTKPGLTTTESVVLQNFGNFDSGGSFRIQNDLGHTFSSRDPGCVEVDSFTLDCSFDSIGAGESQSVDFAISIADDVVIASNVEYQSIWIETFTDLHGSEPSQLGANTVAIWEILTDVEAEFVMTPGDMFVNDVQTFTIAMTNHGPDSTTNLELVMTFGFGHRVRSVTMDSINCMWSDRALSCPHPGLGVGDRVEAIVEVEATQIGSHQMILAIDNPVSGDPNHANNGANISHEILSRPIPAGNASGGGGSIFVLDLLALLICGFLRPRVRRTFLCLY